MKLAAIAKLIKADGYCKLYKVFYDDCRTYVRLYQEEARRLHGKEIRGNHHCGPFR